VRTLTLVDAAISGHAWSAEWVAQFRAVREAGRSGGPEAAKLAWYMHPAFSVARARESTGAASRNSSLPTTGNAGSRAIRRAHSTRPPRRDSRRSLRLRSSWWGSTMFPTSGRSRTISPVGCRARALSSFGRWALSNLESPVILARLIADFVGEFESPGTPA
jgi:hypothetical protein